MLGGKSIITYGESGTYKTANAGFFAKWLYERNPGKQIRLISSDGGGWAPLQSYIDADIIVPWQISGLQSPFQVLRKLSKGFWPIAEEPDKEGLVKLRFQPPSAEAMKGISGYIIEGLTSSGDVVMRQLANKGPKLSQDPSYAYIEGSGDDAERMYGTNMSYFGFVQNLMYDLVAGFNQLPVERVLWTAHEARGEDEKAKEIIIGPSIAGKKSISKCPGWFGDCLHYDFYVKSETPIKGVNTRIQQQDIGVKAWFIPHPDIRTGIMHKAKPRVTPEMVPELMKKFPNGYFTPSTTEGLDTFLEVEAQLLKSHTTTVIGWRKAIDEKAGLLEKKS